MRRFGEYFLIGALIAYAPASTAPGGESHGAGNPSAGRPEATSGPCEGLDGEAEKLILPEAEKRIAKLYLTSALFAAKYKEVAETPVARELQRKDPRETAHHTASLAWSSLFAGVLFIGGASLASLVGEPPLRGESLNVQGRLLGKLAGSSLTSALFFEGSTRGLTDEAHVLTKARGETLKRHVAQGVTEATEFYGELFGWSPEQKQQFNRHLSERGVSLLEETVGLSKFPGGVQARLTEVDPIVVLETMHPDRKEEIAALRDLQKFHRESSKSKEDEPLSPALLQDRLAALTRAARIFAEVNRDLPPFSAARKEGERILAEIRRAEAHLRELCDLGRR